MVENRLLYLIRSIPRWSLTSNRAHCFLELVIIYRPYSCYTAAGIVHTIYKRGYTASRAVIVWSHTHNSVTSSTMIILREVLHTAYAAVGTF